MEYIKSVSEELIGWLKSNVSKAKAKGLIFGLSGGVDSAVVAGFAKKAFPNESLGLIMPCHSNPQDQEDGILVAESLGLKYKILDITSVYDQFLEAMGQINSNKLALANIKPRLRMSTLYYFGQNYNYLVVGPSNKSEFTIGYFTKHGDSGVDLLPLASFTKREVWRMAEFLNIPEVIIKKIPSAGLWENQTDEEEMGFDYNTLDDYIIDGTGSEDKVRKINRMNVSSEHKRSFPPIFLPRDKKI